jgi:hypothetical protein
LPTVFYWLTTTDRKSQQIIVGIVIDSFKIYYRAIKKVKGIKKRLRYKSKSLFYSSPAERARTADPVRFLSSSCHTFKSFPYTLAIVRMNQIGRLKTIKTAMMGVVGMGAISIMNNPSKLRKHLSLACLVGFSPSPSWKCGRLSYKSPARLRNHGGRAMTMYMPIKQPGETGPKPMMAKREKTKRHLICAAFIV